MWREYYQLVWTFTFLSSESSQAKHPKQTASSTNIPLTNDKRQFWTVRSRKFLIPNSQTKRGSKRPTRRHEVDAQTKGAGWSMFGRSKYANTFTSTEARTRVHTNTHTHTHTHFPYKVTPWDCTTVIIGMFKTTCLILSSLPRPWVAILKLCRHKNVSALVALSCLRISALVI